MNFQGCPTSSVTLEYPTGVSSEIRLMALLDAAVTHMGEADDFGQVEVWMAANWFMAKYGQPPIVINDDDGGGEQ